MECDSEILASLCLGTGDIDCVYHGALHELEDAADEAIAVLSKPGGGLTWPEKRERVRRMVDGSRLRDIVGFPLDLLV
jgi:hypothetical protein